MGCCSNNAKQQVLGTSITLLVVALLTFSLGVSNYCVQFNRHDLKNTDDITTGTGYKGEGMWGPSAGIVAGVLGIVAACTEDQTFAILYRIQSAVSCVSVGTTLSAFLVDVFLLLKEYADDEYTDGEKQPYWINRLYKDTELLDILLIWAVELFLQIVTSILSAICICRLGCCCCGCPNLKPDFPGAPSCFEKNAVAPLGDQSIDVEKQNQTETTFVSLPPAETSDFAPPVRKRRVSEISDIKIDQTVTFVLADDIAEDKQLEQAAEQTTEEKEIPALENSISEN